MSRDMTTTKITKGMKLKINGRHTVLTVVRSSDIGFDLVGPRGGQRTVIRNIHRPEVLTMIDMGSMSTRSETVTDIDVVR